MYILKTLAINRAGVFSIFKGDFFTKIGNVEIKGHTVLAPMAGVADTAFRTICKSLGVPFVVGEMASAKGLCMSTERTGELLGITEVERPMAIQLFGDDPFVMAKAVKIALTYLPDIIDINMGCPAPKVTSNGGGSSLMKDPILAGHIIESTVRATLVPVTVKIRKGWDDRFVNAVEIAKIAQECGASAITVHGRTRAQQYAPPVDLDIIAAVKATVSIPVIGNGDVLTPSDAKRMLEYTGCDLVMIGRGALGAPWLFSQIEQFLKDGMMPPSPNLRWRMKVMAEHITLMCKLKGEYAGMREARKHAAWYMKGLIDAACLRSKASGLTHLKDIESLISFALEHNREL